MIPGKTSMAKTDEPSVTYRTEDHVSILFQMYGSIWRRVLPYCLVNLLIAFIVGYMDSMKILDLSFSDKGHTFMSIMVSYLIVTRTHVANQRYMESRKLLSDLMRSCRELVQHMVTFSRYETGQKAKAWRRTISRQTCSLLRTAISVLEYDTKGANVWQLAELSKNEKQALLLSVGGSNERAPFVLATFLRTSIAKHVETLSKPLDVNEDLELHHCLSEFITAYHGLMKLITTPYPFPFVQMTRTVLFVWVFTLPFALDSDIDETIPLMFVVFFVTYGFIGLEFVSMELDDPFGNDPNDFDAMGLAEVVFDDIYITLQDIDGTVAAKLLKESVELPLREQIKREVKEHKKHTRIKSWGGADILMDVSPETFSMAARENTSSSTMKHRAAASVLLESIRSQKSDASIEVYGADEKVKFDLKSSSISVKPKSDKVNDERDTAALLPREILKDVQDDDENIGEIGAGGKFNFDLSSGNMAIKP